MSALAETATIRTPERWSAWARWLAGRSDRASRRNRLAMHYLRPQVNRGRVVTHHWNTAAPGPFTFHLHVAFAERLVERLLSSERHFVTAPVGTPLPRTERADPGEGHESRPSPTRAERSIQRDEPRKNHHSDTLQLRLNTEPVRQMFTRLLQRIERNEAGGRARNVRIVLAERGRAAESDSAPFHERRRGGRDSSRTSHFETPVQTMPAMQPAISVDQITENVMRQLDRRVDSWRERTGRR